MRIGIDARKIGDFGIGTYVRGLMQGLSQTEGEDTYVVLAPMSARSLIPPRFEHVPIDSPHYSLRELWSVGRAAERARLDLLHVPHYVLPVTRVPVVVTIHDLIHLRSVHGNPLKPWYARTMLRRAVTRSAKVLTVSEAVRQDIVMTLGCPAGKISVTPNGIDDLFRAAAPNPEPGPYFLFAGNDKPHKNVDLLVDAFASVRQSAADVSLVLAGAPFERHHGRAGVVAAGYLRASELATLYRNALAVVQPSSEEGFGLPAAEAMASGTAVITSNAPALVEVTGEAALHVDVQSPAELTAAMLRLRRDEPLRLRLARQGIERARTFTWTRCAQLTRAAYDHALRGMAERA